MTLELIEVISHAGYGSNTHFTQQAYLATSRHVKVKDEDLNLAEISNVETIGMLFATVIPSVLVIAISTGLALSSSPS